MRWKPTPSSTGRGSSEFRRVAQTFLSAGSGDILVPCFWLTTNWRLEGLRCRAFSSGAQGAKIGSGKFLTAMTVATDTLGSEGWCCGTVFKVTPNGVRTTITSFSGANGGFPSKLVLGRDGDLYGTTSFGGTDGGASVLALLKEHTPKKAGDTDLCGWEWRYLWKRTRSDELFSPCPKANMRFSASLFRLMENTWPPPRPAAGFQSGT